MCVGARATKHTPIRADRSPISFFSNLWNPNNAIPKKVNPSNRYVAKLSNERRWNGRAEYFKDKDEYENIKTEWRKEKKKKKKNGKGGIYIDWKDNIYNHGYPVLIQDKALPNGKKYGYEVINADLINRMLQGRGLRQT